jgi:HEAT repeat protein
MEATMSCFPLAVVAALALTPAQQPDAAAEATPQTFAKRAEIATGAPALFLAEWMICPGLEDNGFFQQVAELKGFAGDLIDVLRSDDAASRSAGLKYLATLARLVRTTAWWRDRDDGDDLFATALGQHVVPIRTGLETAFKNTTGKDRLFAAVALLALVDDHGAAMDCVIDELHSAEATRRQEACDWIGHVRLSQPRMVAALAAMTTDKELKVRCAAATALLRIGPKAAPAAPALLAHLKTREATTDEALDGIGLAPVVMNISTIGQECSAVGEHLADLKPAVSGVIELLEADGANRRQIAFACLARLGPAARTAVTALQPYVTDQDSATRLCAAATILCIDPDHAGATATLGTALKSDDRELRTRAIEISDELTPKAKALVPLLIESLNGDDEHTRLHAVQALGKMGSLAEPAIPRLAAMLKSKRTDATDAQVQCFAARALVGIGKAGLRALTDNLAKPSGAGWSGLLFALGACRDDSAAVVPILIRALDHDDPAVRMNAATALGRLKRAAAPAREALLRASRRADAYDIFHATPTLAAWALSQLTR